MNAGKTSLELIMEHKNNINQYHEKLSDITYDVKLIESRLKKTQDTAHKLSRVISERVGNHQGLNRDLLKSIGESPLEIIQQQQSNIAFITEKKRELTDVINSLEKDNAYLKMNSTELQQYIGKLKELRMESLMSTIMVTLPSAQIAVHGFMDGATKAYIRKFNREASSTYVSLQNKQKELSNIADQYFSSRIEMLTEYLGDQKQVEEKLDIPALLSEQMVGNANESGSLGTMASPKGMEGKTWYPCMGRVAGCEKGHWR
ncbi:hypothetical protein [Providencia rettgeri]|uniref:hypothetical protein n=1 Tax=Providencia rettgeri TaxID=587 RepID=UPI001B3781F4|nr:hypothetical protein [Providencia rettgeri]MBQ0365995.1 hypothetical protein [Providencia rettgeri]